MAEADSCSLYSFTVTFRNPFEISVAERAPRVSTRSVSPRRQSVNVGGEKYLIGPDPRVKVPDFLIESEPQLSSSSPLSTQASSSVPDHPLVKLRQAIRECKDAGIPDSRLEEVIALEIVDFVMGS